MSAGIVCYNCGQALAALSLPLSRQDVCPGCAAYVHVCRMCEHFDPQVPAQCREDDAEEVTEKQRVNFCEWFSPREHAFDEGKRNERTRSQARLDQLFGDSGEAESDAADPFADAEDLFR